MSAPQPLSLPATPQSADAYRRSLNFLSLGLLVACPVILALPPRKLDLYSFSLATAWVISVDHITAERTGASISQHLRRRAPGFDGLPSERARDVQERLRRERLLRAQQSGQGSERAGYGESLVNRVWMGGETEGWKERREQEEREKLEQGGGYGDLILDQIWEVWNWGRSKGGPAERAAKGETATTELGSGDKRL
ncbi:MAG: hypothetical protein M1832_001896 [Thelocarpon impressellum]|nr:MAG: hypothetical protein M1832_001896 [Thelocarpon impressellum]